MVRHTVQYTTLDNSYLAKYCSFYRYVWYIEYVSQHDAKYTGTGTGAVVCTVG